MTVKFKLKALIEKRLGKKGWSYRTLAQEIGISHGALHQMAENKVRGGRQYNPSLKTLDLICKFFRCQPGDVLEFRNG